MSIVEIGREDSGSAEHAGRPYQAIVPAERWSSATGDEWLLASQGRTFHFAARFLSPELRGDVVTLYAFFRLLDDLVDEPAQGRRVEDIRKELRAWRNWFAGSRSLPAPREPLGARLASVLAARCVPTSIFLDFLDGLVSDLEVHEICDFGELRRYCYRVAGTVGLAMAHVLGASSPQALAAAESLGIGMQLTNILRDVGADLAVGRVYLPGDELARFGCSHAHLYQLLKDQRGPDERFRALMRYQVARAHHYFARGMLGVWLLPPECRLPILIAGRLYRRILTVIEHKNYDVLRSRAATSFPEKLCEAAIAFMLDQLWRHGEARPDAEPEVLFEN